MRSATPFAVRDNSLIASYGAQAAAASAARRRVRDALAIAEKSIRTRSDFLANMNHELRTPLNAIIGFSTMLRDENVFDLGAEQRRSYADYILQAADLLLSHINTILETAALESDHSEAASESFDISACSEAVIEKLAVALRAAQVSIDYKKPNASVTALGDEARYHQALEHVLRAAISSSEKGSRVLLRTDFNSAGDVDVAIRDFGPGYDGDIVQQAREAFRGSGRGVESTLTGAGVGFALARTFVEMQRGRFSIESRKGKGTIVRFSFQSAAKSAAQSAPIKKTA